MLSELQQKNISAMFDALDATADGLLDEADFVARANQMCAALAPDGQSPHHRAIQDAYRQAWDHLRQKADVDHDGRVSPDEYLAAMERGMNDDPEYLDKAAMVVSRALFTAADMDGDGVISREEYVTMFVAIDLDADMAAAGFAHIDQDGDGAITFDEFIEALHGVFSSSDPRARGAHVLG